MTSSPRAPERSIEVSIIVPCLNEAENILELTERARAAFEVADRGEQEQESVEGGERFESRSRGGENLDVPVAVHADVESVEIGGGGVRGLADLSEGFDGAV